MLLLPNHRVIDISTDRARYHALRSHRFHAGDSITQLYPLVDVIYRQCDLEFSKHYCPPNEFQYSGYTIADIIADSDWSEEDKSIFLQWLKAPDQVRRIETARRRLNGNLAQLSVKTDTSPKQLFSALEKRIAALPMKKARVSQWQATVLNMKKNGIREEEIRWSGLWQKLSRLDGESILHKDDLLAAINFENIRLELTNELIRNEASGLRFDEVAQRLPRQSNYRTAFGLDDSCHCILRYVDQARNYRVGVVKTLRQTHRMALNTTWFVLDPHGRPVVNQSQPESLFYADSDSAKHAAQTHASTTWDVQGGARFHVPYDYLSLYGGSDYREWLLSLPDYQRSFFSSHYFDHNVLAHIRTTSRIDHEGRKLLFIEEMQSDWHQSGQRYGYDSSVLGKTPNAPFKKEWLALTSKLMLIQACQNGFDGIAWPFGRIQEIRYARPLSSIVRQYDAEIPKILNKLGRPFDIKTSQSWIETRDPWLTVIKTKDKWRVSDGTGKFNTRARYINRDEAMEVLARHCKAISLQVPVFLINDELRQQVNGSGLPLFGETHV